MKKNIAIIRGGNSSESTISIKSAAVVYSHIDTDLYNPFLVHIQGTDWYVVQGEKNIEINKNDFSFEVNNTKINFDGVFMAIHGTPGEDGILQGYFDLLNIPYNCSGSFEASITFNKAMCNTLLKQFNILSAKAVILNKNEPYNSTKLESEIGLPCFVKPNRAGSSFGISKVTENHVEIFPKYAQRHSPKVQKTNKLDPESPSTLPLSDPLVIPNHGLSSWQIIIRDHGISSSVIMGYHHL